MRTGSFLFRIVLMALAFVSASSLMTAQLDVPGKPIEFQAKAVEVTPNGGWAKLMWMANREGGIPTEFNIYIAEGETDDMSKFEKIGGVAVDPNDMPDNGVFTYIVKDLPLGTYSFYVVAVNASGESQRSVIRVVVLKVNNGEDKKVVIVSKPSNTAKVGSTYEYKVKFEANFDAASVRYAITRGPDGMTIDEKGNLRWENAKAGRYEIRIVVWVTAADGTVKEVVQEFVLEVGDGREEPKEPCTKICGTVKNEDGEPVKRGILTAWSMTEKRDDNGGTNTEWRAVYKVVVENGEFCIKVNAGTYKLKFEGEGYYTEWWENSENSDDATDVTVTCDAPVDGINMVVAARPTPKFHVVTGRVYDAESNEGLKNALVTFTARDAEGRENQYKVRKAETNADGVYRIELPEGYSYTATAIARDNREGTKSQYLQEWWENTHDATQASTIEITDDKEGVDFPMDKRAQVEGGFGGTMKDNETGTGVPGKVTAFQLVASGKDNGNDQKKLRVETVETDAEGNYSFTNLDPGTYIVFGMPGERPYVPGWHVIGAVAAHSWKDASEIEVADVMLTVQHDILLETAKDGVGRGKLRGWVYDKRGGIVKSNDGDVQVAEGIIGSLVVAIDEAGTVVDFAMSTEEGSYDMSQLGLGNSTVIADRFGYEPTTETVTFDANTLTQSVSLGLIKMVTSVEVPTDLVGTTLNLYPNPASSTATLSIPTVEGTASIRMVSAAGLVLSNEMFTVTNGTTSFTLNTASLPMGMVMVHVTNGTSTFALPLQIVR